MNLRDSASRESKMTVVSQEPRIDIGDFTGQPLSMGKGNHSVLLAVHEQDRDPDIIKQSGLWCSAEHQNRDAIRLTRFTDTKLASVFC